MREKPIPFNAEMVLAVLAGRKTQTRRIVTVPWGKRSKTVPYSPYFEEEDGRLFFQDEYGDHHDFEKKWKCPYGNIGDHLWVREPWCVYPKHDHLKPSEIPHPEGIGDIDNFRNLDICYLSTPINGYNMGRYRSPRFMPHWASRITLEIKNIRVERVQDISAQDCMREGIREVTKDGISKKYCIYDSGDYSSTPWQNMPRTAKGAFKNLWNSINEKRGLGWDKNPWVWVVEFETI